MKLVLVEPVFTSRHGHYLNYLLGIASVAARRRIGMRVISGRQIERDAREALEVVGVTCEPRINTSMGRRFPIRALNWFAQSAEYFRHLDRELHRSDPQDLVCTISGEVELIAGGVMAARLHRGGARPLMHMFHWVLRSHMARMKLVLKACDSATRHLYRSQPADQGLVLLGQTEPVARYIGNQLGRPVQAAPLIINWSDFTVRQALAPEPTVGFFGATRWDKGFPQFAEAALALPKTVRLVVQAQLMTGDPDRPESRLLGGLKQLPNSLVVDQTLSTEKYATLFSSVDILALPYLPVEYRHRTSGMFGEAIGLNIIPVVPAGTWMSDICREAGIGVAYSDYTVYGLRSALEEAIDRRRELHARLTAFSDEWRRNNTAEQFVDALFHAAGKRLEEH